MTKEDQTIGELRVRVDFNVSNSSKVARLKRLTAELINESESMRVGENGEAASSEVQRLISLAQTAYEEAGIWAVKAATA